MPRHVVPLPCRAAKGLECLSHLIHTVRPCLIHTCHAAAMPCSEHAVRFKATAQHGRLSTALCRGLEKKGMVRAWNGRGMTSVNQTRPHYVNQMGKTHSKPLAARHVRGTAWARHGHGMLCETAFSGTDCLQKPTILVKKFTAFIKPDGSLPSSQQPVYD